MITGFNTDVRHNDRVYHIQTEDKGLQNPYVESLIYVGGEILANKKTSYADQLQQGVDEKWISGLMEQQHRTMIAAVKRGRFDQLAEGTQSKSQAPKATVPQKASAAVIPDSEKTLDQVILDYLATESQNEHLELSMPTPTDFVAGEIVEFKVLARKSLSHLPLQGVVVEIRVISTTDPPKVVYKGKTGADGAASVRCTIPVFREGNAAVIVSAHSELGNDEIKQLVKRRN